MHKNRYRIVTDSYLGFEVQIKRWWFPFWVQCGGFTGCNTHMSIEAAEAYARRHADNAPVKDLGFL